LLLILDHIRSTVDGIGAGLFSQTLIQHYL